MIRVSTRRRPLLTRAAARQRRPLVEPLESRTLLAFDLTLSTSPTFGVSVTSFATTRTFTATAHGANVSFADIQAALSSSLSVSINTGAIGSESGSVTATDSASFTNQPGTSLSLYNGSGFPQTGGITLAGLSFSDPATTLSIFSNQDVILNGPPPSPRPARCKSAPPSGRSARPPEASLWRAR